MGDNHDDDDDDDDDAYASLNLKQIPGHLNFWRLVSSYSPPLPLFLSSPPQKKNFDQMPHPISM